MPRDRFIGALLLAFSLSASVNATASLPVIHITGIGDRQSISALRRAIARQSETGTPTRIVLFGQFSVDRPLRLTANRHLTITASGRPAELVAKNGALRGFEIVGGTDVRISGLRLRGFKHDGIFVKDSQNVVIEHTTVRQTHSNAWSQGAIHLTGSVARAVVHNNEVENAGFGGIVVDTDAKSDVSGVRITNNRVRQTCRRVYDCGAIYVNDRGRRSRAILIANNEVSDFGPVTVGGRGIYLDDWSSHVTVRNNSITGPGRFAFQIHGGHDNLITRNRVNMNQIATALLYEAANDGTRAAMTGNIVADNVFTSTAGDSPKFAAVDRAGAGAVRLLRNQQCAATRCKNLP